MHKLHELKEMLCDELEEYGSKGKLDVGSLDVVDKLAHAIKNIDKIIENYEEDGYSSRSYMRMDPGMRGVSYARGGRMNPKRDSMGRYSRAESDFMEELRNLAESAPNETFRKRLQDMIRGE